MERALGIQVGSTALGAVERNLGGRETRRTGGKYIRQQQELSRTANAKRDAEKAERETTQETGKGISEIGMPIITVETRNIRKFKPVGKVCFFRQRRGDWHSCAWIEFVKGCEH